MTSPRFRRLFSQFLIVALFFSCRVVAQQQGAPAPGTPAPPAAPATAVEGTWSVTPLVMKGVAAPGGSGQLLEFGEAYTTESFQAFWARTGPDPQKDWVLFSWKDGQLARVLQRDVKFVAPDSRQVTVHADTPIHVGKRLLYISLIYPNHVYAWDGEKLVKVLCAGDELQFGNERYSIKRASVLDTAPDGRAVIKFDAPSQHASGWVVHDGSTFAPLWKKGDELPGIPGVRIENLSDVARMLEDGSLLAILRVTAGEKKVWALYRIWAHRSEEIATEGQHVEAGAVHLGRIFDATLRAFVMDATQEWTGVEGPATTVYYTKPQFMFFDAGKVQVLSAMPRREFATLSSFWWSPDLMDFALESAVILAPESGRALLTVMVARKGGFVQNKVRSCPGLYFWDGQKLSSVAWEEAVGLSVAAAVAQLETRARRAYGSHEVMVISLAARIRIRSIPGPIGGVSVRLPDLGDKPRTWYVPANSTDGKLQQPPRFAVAEHAISLADVISWKEDEVLALTEEGLFRLRRAP